MKIVKITDQHRRDFSADMKCEFCNHETKLTSGYDDQYYHSQVIPNMVCKKCGESTISGGGSVGQVQTKYPEGFQV
jgi:transcription elongation factor Elf1